MRETSPYQGDHYRPGDYYRICDECGRTFRKSETRKRWDGAWVCFDDWEPRHPQEFLRGRIEKIRADEPRPETYLPILLDDCSSSTNWTVGTGWSHDSTEFEFNHTSGTAALDRAVTGLTSTSSYILQVIIGNITAGSVVISLVTSSDEAGDLTVTADKHARITFTAGATTDTVRFTPSTDFNGSIQAVYIYPNSTTVTQASL